ncbi:hypothetical protein BaRGS_00038724 [Batillaria attramentaria]|uniref:Uncharacterized protein n=1 Tax=Batillaria attramentaria TaxID=370345 RepID=A0ABD0J5F0_9CAEN
MALLATTHRDEPREILFLHVQKGKTGLPGPSKSNQKHFHVHNCLHVSRPSSGPTNDNSRFLGIFHDHDTQPVHMPAYWFPALVDYTRPWVKLSVHGLVMAS